MVVVWILVRDVLLVDQIDYLMAPVHVEKDKQRRTNGGWGLEVVQLLVL